MSTPLEPVHIPPTPDGTDVTLGHPATDIPATRPHMRLWDIISDAVDIYLNEQDAGRDVSTPELTDHIQRAIVDASGGARHIVRVNGYSWTVQHPITERFESTQFDGNYLFHCTYNTLIAEADFEGDGMYQVWLDRTALRWEPVHP